MLLTLDMLGLNAPPRCMIRRRRWRDVGNALRGNPPDEERLQEMLWKDSYRFVAACYVAALPI